MKHRHPSPTRHSPARALAAGALALGLSVAAAQADAVTATIYGSIGNFDVINHTGQDAHGFELDIDGVPANARPYTFSAQRYGQSTIAATPSGIAIRWQSATDPATGFTATTRPYTGGGAFGGTCYMGGINYAASGCEHFGVSLFTSTAATYRWLVEDPANPGTLIPSEPGAPVATPYYSFAPPAAPGVAPVLVVEVQAPEPPERPEIYGDAQWMRVFVNQVNRVVTLDELVTTNPIVPQDPTQVETNWTVIQAEPAALAAGNGKHTRSRKRSQGALKPDTQSVVRRIEMYTFTGTYDPVTHEALCADTLCNAPSVGELGDLESAQMTAAIVQQDNVIVTKNGSGNVSTADGLISCGSKCAAAYDAGRVVALTASAGGKTVFAGWTGDCAAAGTASTCNVTINGGMRVGANFSSTFVLSAKTSGGAGLVTSSPGGINCGSGGNSCNTSALSGALFSLTATPATGFRFVGWSGACSGSGTCNVVLNGNATVQANFAK